MEGKITQVQKLISILSDGNWHHSTDLDNRMGWKWGARLADARDPRKHGYTIEDKRDEATPKFKYYRLIHMPVEAANNYNLSIIQQFNFKMGEKIQKENWEKAHPKLI
jgi:hypothetical protein